MQCSHVKIYTVKLRCLRETITSVGEPVEVCLCFRSAGKEKVEIGIYSSPAPCGRRRWMYLRQGRRVEMTLECLDGSNEVKGQVKLSTQINGMARHVEEMDGKTNGPVFLPATSSNASQSLNEASRDHWLQSFLTCIRSI